MTKLDLAVVLCRFFGLYLIISAITVMGQTILSFCLQWPFGMAPPFLMLVLNAAIPQLVTFLVGFLVWRAAGFIGQKMTM